MTESEHTKSSESTEESVYSQEAMTDGEGCTEMSEDQRVNATETKSDEDGLNKK